MLGTASLCTLGLCELPGNQEPTVPGQPYVLTKIYPGYVLGRGAGPVFALEEDQTSFILDPDFQS